jgi:predicted type IV restriction endonuclease
MEKLIAFIENLKTNRNIGSFDEAATKQAIILPILQMLGWNIFDIDEVMPELSTGNGRVDYSLKLDGSNKVFIEAKNTSEDLERHEEQLLDYSFREGVEIAALTNGTTWWFYLPTQKGDWKERKFFTIDLIQQDSRDASSKFTDLLLKTKVMSGAALENAECI